MAKEKELKSEDILSSFMNYLLETESEPNSVYKFCKENNYEESDFYKHFGSIESLKKGVWVHFFNETQRLSQNSEEYETMTNRDKMLTFLYTFFELLTLNRSYVLLALGKHKDLKSKMDELKYLRHNIKEFAQTLLEAENADKNYKIAKKSPKLVGEGAWVQFLFLLNFWMKDDSSSFEKTDIAIEKSVNTIFDVFDNSPIESVIYFGKFLIKDRFK